MGNAKTAVRILNGEMINKVVVERQVAPARAKRAQRSLRRRKEGVAQRRGSGVQGMAARSHEEGARVMMKWARSLLWSVRALVTASEV